MDKPVTLGAGWRIVPRNTVVYLPAGGTFRVPVDAWRVTVSFTNSGSGLYMDGVETANWTDDNPSGEKNAMQVILGGLFDGNARPVMVFHTFDFSAPLGSTARVVITEEVLEAWNR